MQKKRVNDHWKAMFGDNESRQNVEIIVLIMPKADKICGKVNENCDWLVWQKHTT